MVFFILTLKFCTCKLAIIIICGPEVLFETCVAMKFVDDDNGHHHHHWHLK